MTFCAPFLSGLRDNAWHPETIYSFSLNFLCVAAPWLWLVFRDIGFQMCTGQLLLWCSLRGVRSWTWQEAHWGITVLSALYRMQMGILASMAQMVWFLQHFFVRLTNIPLIITRCLTEIRDHILGFSSNFHSCVLYLPWINSSMNANGNFLTLLLFLCFFYIYKLASCRAFSCLQFI